MSKKPSHFAYVVSEPKPGQTAFWTRIGAVFPHKGEGFDVVIQHGIAVSGRIVCTPPKQGDEDVTSGNE